MSDSEDPFKHQNDDSVPAVGLPAPNCLHPEVQTRLQRMEIGIYDIKTALIGSKFGNKGLIFRLGEVEVKLEGHDRKLLVWGSVMTAIGAVLIFIRELYVAVKK